MPFCSNCGRQLEENESCNCQNQQNAVQNQAPPPPPNVNVQPGYQQYDQYGRPLFTPQGQPIYYDAQGNAIVGGQKKKSNAGCIIALCVTLFLFLIVGGIIAAIFVPAMLGYVKKSKINSANGNARTITRNINAALTEMDEKGMTINGTYIVCSDSNKTIVLDNGNPLNREDGLDLGTLYSTAKEYGNIGDYDWFVVIENGIVTYAVAGSSGDENYVGTYPKASDASRGSPTYGGTYYDDADFDYLYHDAVAYPRLSVQ